jgi:small subunit ribosomal protein S2
VPMFSKAYHFLLDTVANGGKILFVGTKKQAQEIISEQAKRADQFFVNNRWLGGTLTNYRTIKASIDRLRGIDKMEEDGTFEKLQKKEVLRLTRERAKLERNLGGIKDMAKLPGAVFVVDTRKEHIAVAEARKLGVPVVAVVDTNCDPDDVDMIIPGNDDAIRAIRIFVSKAADACIEGAGAWEKKAAGHREDEKTKKDTGPAPGTPRERPEGEGGPKVEIVRAPGAEEAPAATDEKAEASPT